jgi:hypothetical protein
MNIAFQITSHFCVPLFFVGGALCYSEISSMQPSLLAINQDVTKNVNKSDSQGPKGQIISPQENEYVEGVFNVKGTLEGIPDDHYVWVVIRVGNLSWPKEPSISSKYSNWSIEISEGGNSGKRFSVALVIMNKEGNDKIEEWFKRGEQTGKYPGFETIPGSKTLSAVQLILK